MALKNDTDIFQLYTIFSVALDFHRDFQWQEDLPNASDWNGFLITLNFDWTDFEVKTIEIHIPKVLESFIIMFIQLK